MVSNKLDENSLISEARLILNAPSKIKINNVKVVQTGAIFANSFGEVKPNPLGPIRKPNTIRKITSGMLVLRNKASDIKPKIAIKLIANNAEFATIKKYLNFYIY
tara:strand:+ start:142 stop:456 length:315 start_codon:yes stop_codon:yes gene_type:complete